MKKLPLILLCFTFICNGQIGMSKPFPTVGRITQKSEALNTVLDPSQPIEVLAEGFIWAEGPLWVSNLDGLLFTDVPNNKAYLWSEKNGLRLFLDPSGHTGYAPSSLKKGANGLTLDADGNLILCQVGDRRIARLKDWTFKSPEYDVLIDRFDDRLFNSPNDLVVSKQGVLYFTDPPYGLAQQDKDPLKELPFNGVFRYDEKHGVSLLTDQMTRPNGIALSLDEKTLFVANSDKNRAVILAFDLVEGGVENERVFFDGSHVTQTGAGAFDGLKIHSSGILFATGPGGVLVIDEHGKHLGTIRPDSLTANCAFDAKENYLYMTSHKSLTRIKLK